MKGLSQSLVPWQFFGSLLYKKAPCVFFAECFAFLLLDLPFCVAGDVAAYVYRNGQACYMGGSLLDVYCKAGLGTAEALGADTEAVYLFKHFCFKVGIELLGIALTYGAAESFLGEIGTLLEIAAYADTYDDRGTGV